MPSPALPAHGLKASLSALAVALLLRGAPGWAADAAGADTVSDPAVAEVIPPAPTPPDQAPGKWYDVTSWPVIPVPVIDADPNSGVTLGVLPTWLHSNDQQQINRIIAPDLTYNPNFGVGTDFRIFSYPSSDEQWSVVASIKQRVERGFDSEYEFGRNRETNWSIATSLVYDRSGTDRFFGFGNKSLYSNQTNYTASQSMAQAIAGYNFNHTWQLQYTLRAKHMDVLPGTLSGIPSIQVLFPGLHGLGNTDLVLNRFALVYDTRDDPTVPTRGAKWVVYAGVASHGDFPFNSSYSEAGLDGRNYIRFSPLDILATHFAIRYMPTTDNVPFWALSSLGGANSDIGEQLLRGYGAGRFYGRDSLSTTVEWRHQTFSFDVSATHVDIEVTPFVDAGRVFSHGTDDPFTSLHPVAGVGFRGIARPSVVGYVDIGYGSEGAAVFTGIDYPF